jgi:non-haem Fe2+, alpha-ketoglutarate-dependent halogenase
VLTAAQRDEFEQRGVVAPLDLLTPSQVARYREAFAHTTAGTGPRARLDELHRHFAWAQELATLPRLLDSVASLIGDDILVHAVLVLSKYPGRPGKVPWHQDSFYSGWHRSPSVSAWIALTPSTRESGCMRVIEGSHRQGPRGHDERPGPENLLWGGLTISEMVDESRARDLILQPGEMSLHQCNLLHGSEPNRSSEPRVGFIVRFVTPAYRETRGPMLQGRGVGEAEHLDWIERLGEWTGGEQQLAGELARWKAGGGDGQFSNDGG